MASPTAKRSKNTMPDRDEVLSNIQDRVLWLSTQMIHHANSIRENPDGVKVGGHQASCASVVTILTSLFFDYMDSGDRIAIKPHASPVFHAIQYLLGNLDQSYLGTLREFHGLQSYPSRTKDPDQVDFSTGSVGLGAIAPNFAALTEEYVLSRPWGPSETKHKYISLGISCHRRDTPEAPAVWHSFGFFTKVNIDAVFHKTAFMRVPTVLGNNLRCHHKY